LEHIPFAFWLIESHQPRVLVELGTKFGTSYFAFCQAVEKLGLDTRCFAVDTWKGDDHTGIYDEAVFEKAKNHNEAQYSGFSRLVRSTFDETLKYFSDGQIDLLHIDGLHTFEAVRHDFDSWLPKLSNQAVVVMHDTNVREREFGVFKFFESLKEKYPAFEFVHGHGLGVLKVGSEQKELLQHLFNVSGNNDSLKKSFHEIFARLGRGCADSFTISQQQGQTKNLKGQVEKQKNQVEELKQSLEKTKGDLIIRCKELNDTKAKLQTQVEQKTVEKGQLTERVNLLQEIRAEMKERTEQQQSHIDSVSLELNTCRNELLKFEKDNVQYREQLNSARADLEVSSTEVNEFQGALQKREEAIKLLEEANKTRLGELAQLKKTLNERDSEIGCLSREIVQKDQGTAESRIILQQHEQNIKQLKGAAEEHSSELQVLNNTIAGMGSEITRLVQLLTERDRDLDTSRNKVGVAKEALERLQEEFDHQMRKSEQLVNQLKERNLEIRRLSEDSASVESIVRARDAELSALKQENEGYGRVNKKLEEESQAMGKVLSESRQNVQDRFLELATLTKMLEEKDREIEDKVSEIERQKQKIENLRRSFSWRATKPIRFLGKLFWKKDNKEKQLINEIDLIKKSGLFNGKWYLEQYPDVAESGMDPVEHYLRFGASEGRYPSSDFDAIQCFGDMEGARVNPLLNHIKSDKNKGKTVF
jgi:septal ring factor EnvC (AmiA/AmiB activator)